MTYVVEKRDLQQMVEDQICEWDARIVELETQAATSPEVRNKLRFLRETRDLGMNMVQLLKEVLAEKWPPLRRELEQSWPTPVSAVDTKASKDGGHI